MVSGGRKQIAWFFILLLAGHEVAEAARMHKTRRSRAEGFQPTAPLPSDQEAEAAWQAENAKCGSKHLFWCADGPKNPNDEAVRRCAKQPMSGDVRTTNEVCRVTDDWMLKGTPEKPASWWLTVQIKLLKAKTAKLVESCGASNAHRNERKCERRMQHILRSLRFIAKASNGGTLGELSEEQVNEAKDAANAAREQIGIAMFDSPQKQKQLSRLAEALKKDQKGLQQDPKATITRGLKILEEDILPDDVDPAVAEEKIEQMELEAKPADPQDDEAAKARVQELEDDMANAPGHLHDTFDDAIQETESSFASGFAEEEDLGVLGNMTSLMQLRGGERAVKVVGFVAIAVLLVMGIHFAIHALWGLLVFWIVASIFGCTVGAIVDHSKAPFKQGLRWFGGCVTKWVSMPFILMFRGLKWIQHQVLDNSLSQIDARSGVKEASADMRRRG